MTRKERMDSLAIASRAFASVGVTAKVVCDNMTEMGRVFRRMETAFVRCSRNLAEMDKMKRQLRNLTGDYFRFKGVAYRLIDRDMKQVAYIVEDENGEQKSLAHVADVEELTADEFDEAVGFDETLTEGLF